MNDDQIGNKLLDQQGIQNHAQNNNINYPAVQYQPVQQPQYIQQPQYYPQQAQGYQNQQNAIIAINVPPLIQQQQQNQPYPQQAYYNPPNNNFVPPQNNIVQGQILPNITNVHANSVQIQCPYCGVIVFTKTEKIAGGGTWMMVFIVGIFCCCCFCIPLCNDDCKDVIHTCQHCGAEVGKYQYKPFG